jgi:hypothetical protein
VECSNEKDNVGILYTSFDGFSLVRYIDGDWVGSIDDCKPIASYALSFGSSVIAWPSMKLSTFIYL